MATAFEAIVTRQSWYAAAAVAQYYGVQYDANGKFAKADGTRPFAGIVQYGADAADDMITVVTGDYPAIASEAITVGSYVAPDTSTAAGKFRVADVATEKVYGIALTAAAAAGELFTIHTLPVPTVVPGT